MATEIKLENNKTISVASLDKGEKILTSKGYKLGGGNPTGYMHMVAYATRPITHVDAVTIGKALFAVRNIGIPFSKITTLHSTPATSPRIYKQSGPLWRYSADFTGYFFGTVRFACVEHKLNRSKCAKACLQGLYDTQSEKWLGEIAGTYKPTGGKPKAMGKAKRGTKKVIKPQTPNTNENAANVERLHIGDKPINDTVSSEAASPSNN